MNEDELYKINEEDYCPPVKMVKKGIRKRCRITDQQRLAIKAKRINLCSMVAMIYFSESDNRYKQYYVSGGRRVAKYCTNRRLRNMNNKYFPMKCGTYRLYYDYMWTIW